MFELLVLSVFIIITIVFAILVLLEKKLMRAVLYLAMSAVGSSLLFLYLNQVIVSLLQLFVFVGGLSTYLVVAVAAEERDTKRINKIGLFFAIAVIAIGFSLMARGIGEGQLTGSSFVLSAKTAFETQYALLYASVFLLFAAAIGSVVVIKKFSKRVV